MISAKFNSPLMPPKSRNDFRTELTKLLNKHSMEGPSSTPDFLLANFLISCLDTYDLTVRKRDEWHKE